MPELPSVTCPRCQRPLAAVKTFDKIIVTRKFEDCLRRCEPCGVGASNAADPNRVTYIHRDPLENIPVESCAGASEALAQALNVRSRESKWRRFGFSTSEDAVTWVVFTYLLRSGQLRDALRRVGLITNASFGLAPTLLLWGVPIDDTGRGTEIRKQLSDHCVRLQEDPNSFSEPDVIIDLGSDGLVFIEVKYLSRNDRKAADYPGWSRYATAAGLVWRIGDVRASGCYELARNWCLLKALAGRRLASLVNLGPAGLFAGAEGLRLDQFIAALDTDDRARFVKNSWPKFLGTGVNDMPDWFARFCRDRSLLV